MPTIIVRSNASTEHDTAIMLSEDVRPEHLASKHHAAQLIERVGWAVTDAQEVEDTRPHQGAGKRSSALAGSLAPR
jgi:hypothetical protein